MATQTRKWDIDPRFFALTAKHPYLSSLIIFAKTIRGGKFKHATIQRHLNKLVDKSDYEGVNKRAILRHLYALNDPPTIPKSPPNQAEEPTKQLSSI